MSQSFSDAVRSILRQAQDAQDGFIVTAECTPPRGASADSLKACASSLAGLVNAINVPECEDGVRMSAAAACGHLIAAGAEPILHLLTRDMNRIALQAALLGAASMGVKSVLCTTGRHQALTSSRSARGVFDVDPIQLLAIADGMRKNGELADGQPIEGKVDFLLGTDTNPFSDPVELQVMTLEKAVAAGADFVITQPVFRLDKFNEWMNLVRERKLHERVCIIAGVLPIASAQRATELAGTYSHLDIDGDTLKRLESTPGVALASETATALKSIEGVRGICILRQAQDAQGDVAKEVLTASALRQAQDAAGS